MKELNKVLYIANSFLDELGEGEIDAVYLIGSHASDKAREQSDIDFLVVGDGFDLVEEERLERAEEGNPFPGLDVSIAPGDVDITFSSNHPREDQPHKKLYPKKINELDQLVENFFQPKRDTLGLAQLVEMVEELMGEATKEGLGEIAKEIVKILQAEDPSDDAVAFINLGDIKIKGTPTSKTIAITNTGDRKTRTKLYTKLDNDQNYTVKIVRRQKSGSDEEFAPRGEVTKDGIAFTLDFYKGSTPKTISNIGNFAEGVTAYAIAAKLANPSQEVSLDDTIRVATNVERSSDGEGKKREIRKDFKVDLPDDNTLDLALGLDKKTFEDLDNPKKWSFADDTVSAALSLVNGEDFVEFISNTSNHTFIINADGVSDQKGSKADIQIQKKNNETGELQGFLNKDGKVSLKTKSTKQLHQTGKDFLKMAEIFENLFGFRIISNNISKKDIKKINNWLKQVDREFLFGKDGFFNKMFDRLVKTPQNGKYLERLNQWVPHYAGGKDMVLVQLGSGDFKMFDLSRQISDEFEVVLTHTEAGDTAGIPKLTTSLKGKKDADKGKKEDEEKVAGKTYDLFSMRPRRDGDGFRFYIEKEKGFNDFYKYEKEKEQEEKEQEEENPLTNPPQ